MPLLPIVEHPDPLLRRLSAPVAEIDVATRELAAAMFETMYEAPGIGLAAVQVGEPRRLLVIDLQPEDESVVVPEGAERPRLRRPQVFINPEILEASEALSTYNEGCLSIPELYADVVRPAQVRARWQDLDGLGHEGVLDGLLATCLQHEIDHLNGVLFVDHLSKLKRDLLLKRYLKQRRDKAAA